MPITSPDMNLPIPVVGVDPAPTWATLLNQCLTIIDGHNHTNGSGVPIVPGAININSDLTFNSNNATDLRTTRFTPQVSPIAASGADIDELYVAGVDLYYNDGNGNQVRITQSGGIAGSPGSIANLTAPASASYVALSTKFVWQSAANTSADMDFGAAIMRNNTASSFALTLQPPTLGANYSITLPALPASQKIMTMDASGIMSAPYTVDGSTIAITANVIGVPNSGIGTLQIADVSVTPAKLSALGQQVSSSSGAFNVTANSYTDVTNLTVTITTTGRPVFVGLQGSSAGSNITGSSNGGTLQVTIIRDSTDIGPGALYGNSGTSTPVSVAVGGIWGIDTGASAGSHTYKVQAKVSLSPAGTGSIRNAFLVAYEL